MDQLQWAQAFRSGDLPSADYLCRVEQAFAAREPSVLAFIPDEKRFERLHREAEALVAQYPRTEARPPLFGLLAGVKDIFHVDGLATRAGSRLPPDEFQGSQAECVTRLKNAGALILGKTVTTEFAYFFPGPTRNPHHPGHTPGGSSSGSAAAVGAGLCPLALGTQTIGSLIRPAAFCGVVAVKPTYARISRDGVIPLSPSLDHVGYFAPDLSTAIRIAPCLYRDWDAPGAPHSKPILGIPEGPYLACASDSALAHFDENCSSLSEAGYVLRRIRVMDDYPAIRARHDVILAAEAANVHRAWFDKYEESYSARFTELIRRGKTISAAQLQDAFQARDRFRAEIAAIMQRNALDLWITPATIASAPAGLESTGDPVMNLPWTQIGFPALNLPAGNDESGLPLGLQLVGAWNSDESLLAWARGLEKVLDGS